MNSDLRHEVIQPTNASLPTRVSYSQMAQYEQCPMKYYFNRIAGFTEPQTAALVGGTVTHEVIEHLYRLPAEERTLEKALELLSEIGPKLLTRPDYQPFANDNDMKHKVKDAIEGLFKVEDPQALVVDPDHLEMELNVEVNGVPFFGKVDRLTVDGHDRVSDYKTGKASNGQFLEAKFDQPYLYALAFQLQYNIDITQVELIFLNERVSHTRPVDAAKTLQMGDKLAKMRDNSVRDFETASWNCVPARLCDWCAFKPVCPAQNSNAPKPGSSDSAQVLFEKGLTSKHYN